MKPCCTANNPGRRFFQALGTVRFLEALALAMMVSLKILFFYALVDIQSYFAAVWLTGCIFAFLLFSSFRSKLVPAAIYLLVSALMFMDVTYFAYFNKYLSVNVLGAAAVLGDIGDSFLAVVRPEYFLLFFDAAALLAVLLAKGLWRRWARRGLPGEGEEAALGAGAGGGEGGAGAGRIEGWPGGSGDDDGIRRPLAEGFGGGHGRGGSEGAGSSGDAGSGRGSDEGEGEGSGGGGEAPGWKTGGGDPGGDGGVEAPGEGPDGGEGPGGRRAAAAARAWGWLGRHKSAALLVALAAFIIWNPFGAQALTAIANQEIVTYHISDALGGVFGGAPAPDGFMELIAADSYADEKHGELFGVAKGKNLIMIQVESLQNFVVGLRYNGKEVTPNLNRLIDGNTAYFDSIFHQVGGGNTSDAEFAVNNSICGTGKSYTYKLFPGNVYRGLPVLLGEKGYRSNVFHAHEDRTFWNRQEMYEAQGFGRYYGGLIGRDGDYLMTEWMGWGLADSEFFAQTVPFMEDIPSPSYSFVISLSNHHPFQPLEKYRFMDILPADQRTIVGNYIQSVAYTDYAIGEFLDGLKEAGLYEDSLLVIYGDHQGMPVDDRVDSSMQRLFGIKYDYDVMMNIPLIISLPEGADIRGTVGTTGGQIDFLPTIAYLMGFEELDTLYLGHNLMTTEGGFAAVQSYMIKGSFIEGETVYEMSRDGIFENGRAWRRGTGESVPLEECRASYQRALQIIDASEYILENDLLAGDWRGLRAQPGGAEAADRAGAGTVAGFEAGRSYMGAGAPERGGS